MPTKDIAGVTVEVNEEGYLTDPTQWTQAVGEAIAVEEGISLMTEEHWKLVHFLQKDYAENGVMPTIRRVKSTGGIPVKELYALYPGGPLKKSSKIAGLPKPASCI
ncbi:MAG: TusE/DsrC/DsvC family sulfur relay protein [Lentisphaerae bacterium]|nr:TusE/DsrC/DsvC family sulfur relay protein [Lentisphaerota bacterium]